jgi:hypothetical protein
MSGLRAFGNLPEQMITMRKRRDQQRRLASARLVMLEIE